MKYLLLLILVPSSLFSQQKTNEVYYRNGLIAQEIVQNYLTNNEKIIQNKIIGKSETRRGRAE